MAETFVLDSFAILALLSKEEGGEKVADLLQRTRKGSIQTLMTWVNVGEVAYIVERRWGIGRVYQVLGNLEATKVEIIPVERELALTAAHIKAGHPLAYADAFAAALALIEKGTLVTGDPEFKLLENSISIQWITGQT
ncbi:MAG: PIN domain-containing protein [Anaerolineae bacterium]